METAFCYTCREHLPTSHFYPDKRRSGTATWTRRCHDCQRAYHREWSHKNRKRIDAKRAEAAKNAPHQKSYWQHAYRARKAGVESTLTLAECDAVFAAFGGRCAYCGAVAQSGKTGQIALDHMVPLARGGTNSIENVVPACWSCNGSKKRMTPLEWFLYSLTPVYGRDFQRRAKVNYLGGGERHLGYLLGHGLSGAGCT
jgi:5-methylcytosine-specific restriction endonuclease McrA